MTKRSHWVELVETRSDGEEVVLPFRIRACAGSRKIRGECHLETSPGVWTSYVRWPWEPHPHASRLDQLELDNLAIRIADTFRDWLSIHESSELGRLVESSRVVTGWESDDYFIDADRLLDSHHRPVREI